jgi:trehalose synthase
MFEVTVPPRAPQSLRTIAGEEIGRRYERSVERARRALAGRTLWHVNSTAEGGGVAELLRSSLGYLAEDGITTRWLVVEGDSEFFRITKRIHNRLHGVLGDGGPLGDGERAHYDLVTRANAAEVSGLIGRGDVVVLHDPQPLGLAPALRSIGATVIWTCHIGIDRPNDLVGSAVGFLLSDVRSADAVTFTRRSYVWRELDEQRIRIIPPCIDARSLKNVALELDRRDAILTAAGVFGPARAHDAATFTRDDGTVATISHTAEVTEDAPTPNGVPLVVQVSRWDALKDPLGVMRGFVDEPGLAGAHLILAGPAPNAVADDPEAMEVLTEVRDHRSGLAAHDRGRVHLVNLPIDDIEENAVIVNALQRRADAIVQKSLAEGFGLTVAEAMWKARPVIAGRVGGIQDQIDDGTNGILVDPRDLTAFGNAVALVVEDPSLAEGLGAAAERTVRERYLVPTYLGAYLDLVAELSWMSKTGV